jgi:hypothetical protein
MEEFVDHGHQPKGEHVHSEFLIPSSQSTAFFIPSVHSFNDVSLAIGLFVKVSLSGLVFPSGNHRFDVMSLQPSSDPWITVAFVPDQLLRPKGLSTMAAQEYVVHQGLESFRLMLLTGSQVDAHHNSVWFDQQMHLGAEAPSGVAQRMVLRFKDLHSFATVKLGGRAWMVEGSACGSTGSDNGAIDTPQAMSEATVAFQMVEQLSEEFGPGAIPPPTIKAVINGLPRTIAFRHVTPRGSGMENPENAVKQAKMGEPGVSLATVMGGVGQERLKPSPLTGGKFIATTHGKPPFGIRPAGQLSVLL